ncbi:transcriptional regulator, LacI family [Arboricoccus pini]|uniref:Transcriptional regulator, LacI family n=1 Tax=Arboricoccus pini TaxID=1963835 RepID=A0A212RFU3_9PROT|nr:LacI family DNA-binding transcriptional regulator [Arboricoccus pini]SNB71093.1 transcriptional regulator, LacI family [Arboricoccus pini]
MHDVAHRAGVSQMTVSRALRAPDKVAEVTRRRIQRAMDELGYIPDLGASALASRQSGLIAAIVSTLENSIFAQTISGLSTNVVRHGYSMLLGTSDYSTVDEEKLLRTVLGRRPDGIVLTDNVHTAAARKLLSAARVPVVETWQLPDQPIDMAVGFSNRSAARAMTRALFSYGYRRIAFVGLRTPDDRRGQLRRRGYRDAIAYSDQSPRELFLEAAKPDLMAGATALEEIVERFPETDAIFCAVDILAAGIYFAAQRRGWSIPERFALAGFGDFAIAQAAGLDLTTVRVDGEQIGSRAGDLLLARLRKEILSTATIDVGYKIIRRSSA